MRKIFTLILLLAALFVGISTYAQPGITLGWGAAGPPFTACVSTPVLSVTTTGLQDSSTYTVSIEVSDSFIISSIDNSDCNNVSLSDDGNGVYTLEIQTLSEKDCTTELNILVKCNDTAGGNTQGSISAALLQNNIQLASSDMTGITVARPGIQWDGYSDCGGSRNSYIGAVEEYQHTILVDWGSIQYLKLAWQPEDEFVGHPSVTISVSGGTPIDYSTFDTNNELLIDILSDFGALLTPNESVEIIIRDTISSCSQNNNQSTIFSVWIPCYPDDISTTCNSISCVTNINVQNAGILNSGIRWRPSGTAANLSDYLTSVPVLSCEPFDFAYYWTVTENNSFPSEAQTIDLNTFNFDLNSNFLNIGNTVLINGFPVTITNSAGSICSRQNIGNIARFNFKLNQNSYPPGWPLLEGNTAGFYNGVSAGSPIIIVFPDITVNCTYAESCDFNVGSLTGNSETNLKFTRMCGTGTSYPYMPIRNNYAYDSSIDSETTDLDYAGVNTATVDYHYNFQASGNNPWNYRYTYNSGVPLFDCDNTAAYFIVKLDPWLSLNPTTVSLNGTLITFTYNPTFEQDGTEIVKIPLGNTSPNGTISFEVINDSCSTGSFGFQFVDTWIESYCLNDDCPQSCPIVTGCNNISFFIHCNGDCTPGFPVGTAHNGFSFRRSSFGMTTNFVQVADGDMATAASEGFALNKGYPCDNVTITAQGMTNSYFNNSNLTDLFFEISFPNGGPAGRDNFDFSNLTGAFVISDPSGNCSGLNLPITIPITNVELAQTTDSSFVYIHLDNVNNVYADLLQCNYTIDLEAVVEIDLNGQPQLSAGFYIINQIRGQFGSTVDSAISFSCDSWGANFTILKVENQINNRGWDQIGNNWTDLDYGSDCSNCVKKIVFETTATGGYPGADDFPNEIRPILMWPDNITIDNIENMSFSHAYYWIANNQTYNQQLPGNRFLPVTATENNGTVTLSGIESPEFYIGPCSAPDGLGTPLTEVGVKLNNWPMMDKGVDSSAPKYRQWLIVVFDDDCSTSTDSTSKRKASFQGTFKDLPCYVDRNLNYNFKDSIGTADNMTLSIANNNWTINTFDNPHSVSVVLKFNMLDSPPIPNAFIYIPDNLASNLSVTQSSSSQCGFNLTNMGNGLWQLGSICASAYNSSAPYINTYYTITFDVNYDCIWDAAGGAYSAVDIPIYYGFDCSGQFTNTSAIDDEDESGYPCYLEHSVVHLIPQLSGIAVNGLQDEEAEPCSLVSVEFVVSSIEEADIYDLLADIDAGGLDLISVDVSYNGTSTTITGPFSVPAQINLADIIGGVFPGGHFSGSHPQINITLNLQTPCDGGVHNIQLSASGVSACGSQLGSSSTLAVDVSVPSSVNITPLWPTSWVCNNQFNHVELDVDGILPEAASYTVSMSVNSSLVVVTNTNPAPSNIISGPTNVIYIWELTNPNVNETISFDFLFALDFCDSLHIQLSGTYDSEETCLKDCNFRLDQDFYICCGDCSADFTITPLNTDCCYRFEGVYDSYEHCEGYGYTITDANGYIVVEFPWHNSVDEYCFKGPGTYEICRTVCCAPNGHTLESCQTIVIETECDSSSCTSDFSITQISECCYLFESFYESPEDCENVFYVYNTTTGSYTEISGLNTVEYCFEEPGEYRVCHSVCCAPETTCYNITVGECTNPCEGFWMDYSDAGNCLQKFAIVLPVGFNGTGLTYCWDFGDGATDCLGGFTTNHVYPSGTYTVCCEINYTDSVDNEVACKVCKDFEFKCDKSMGYCYVIDKEGEGRAIDSWNPAEHIVAGRLNGSASNNDIYFAQVNDSFSSNYHTIVTEGYGTIQADRINSVLQFGPYVFMVGETVNLTTNKTNVIVMCTDAISGNILWTNMYGSSGNDIATKVLKFSEEEILVIGHTSARYPEPNAFDLFAMLIRISDGAVNTLNLYGSPSNKVSDISSDAIELHGLGKDKYIISGYIIHPIYGTRSMIAIKLDSGLNATGPMAIITTGDKDVWANGITQYGKNVYLTGATGNISINKYELYVSEIEVATMTSTPFSRKFPSQFESTVGNKIITIKGGDLVLVGEGIKKGKEKRGIAMRLLMDEGEHDHLNPIWKSETKFNSNKQPDAWFNNLVDYTQNRLLVTGARNNTAVSNENNILVANLDIITGEGCCVQPVAFDIREVGYSSTTEVWNTKIEFDYTSYGQAMDFINIIDICKSTGGGVRGPIDGIPLEDAGFTLYPNPNNGKFTVQLKDGSDRFKRITIMDMTGRKVYDQNFTETVEQSFIEITGDNLSGGVYLIQVEGNSGSGSALISIVK